MMYRLRAVTVTLWTLGLFVLFTGTASAHDIPDGASLVMADWVFYVFLIFGLAGLAVLILAYKTGHLFRLEDAKYPMLLIPEDDYYTPPWAYIDEDLGEEVPAS
jgi:hypothetical protein